MNWLAIVPEIALLAMTCVVALADLWVKDKERLVTYCIAQGSLFVIAVIQLWFFYTGLHALRDAAHGRGRPDGLRARPVRDAGDDGDAGLRAVLRARAARC